MDTTKKRIRAAKRDYMHYRLGIVFAVVLFLSPAILATLCFLIILISMHQ